MQLGVVLTGTGAYGAAGIGVLEALCARQTEPFAVCGLGTGAWVAGLHAAGWAPGRMREAAAQAAGMGKRMLRADASARALLRGKKPALCGGAAIARLLAMQTGGRILALCPERAVFPMRSARGALLFATQAFPAPGGAIMTMQASVSFAVRASMTLPPFLTPVEWLGRPLLPERDAAVGARALLAMGAQRVLVVRMQASPRHSPDALELTALAMEPECMTFPPGTAVLSVMMPDGVGALNPGGMQACIEAGKKAAERELDRLFEEMGMAFCRILPFRRDG